MNSIDENQHKIEYLTNKIWSYRRLLGPVLLFHNFGCLSPIQIFEDSQAWFGGTPRGRPK